MVRVVDPLASRAFERSRRSRLIGTVASRAQSERAKSVVDVTVAQGAVRLTGAVPSSWDRLRAALISRSTPGAPSIEDQLTVK